MCEYEFDDLYALSPGADRAYAVVHLSRDDVLALWVQGYAIVGEATLRAVIQQRVERELVRQFEALLEETGRWN